MVRQSLVVYVYSSHPLRLWGWAAHRVGDGDTDVRPAPARCDLLDGVVVRPRGCGALTFAWDLDEDGQFDDAAGTTASRQYTAATTVDVAVRVTDPFGLSASAFVVVHPGDSPPSVIMQQPVATNRFVVGDTQHR